jgi:hypothetical protein
MIRGMRRVGSSLVVCALMALALAAPADAARPVGKVRSIAPEGSYEPVIAHRAKRDEYLVVYGVTNPKVNEGITLESQRVSRGGGRVGSPVQVALLSPQAPPQGHALVHNPRRDEFLLIWRAATGPNNAPHEVYGQRLDPAGRPIGGRATLVRASEPGLRPVTQCCAPPALAYDGRGGYFVAWGTAAGFTDHAVAGRPVNGALKRGTARKLTTRKGSITGWSLASDPSGYLLASWIGGPESAQGVYTDLVTRAGVRRRSTYRVHSPGGDVALARNTRTGRFALAWQEDRSIMDSEEPLRVQQLDASGRSLGPRSVVPPYKSYRRTTIEGLTYNHAADEYVLGWIGVDQRDPTTANARSALRSLTGTGAKPFGPVSVPAGLFGPFAGASTRAARWLVLSSTQTGLVGQIYAPNR